MSLPTAGYGLEPMVLLDQTSEAFPKVSAEHVENASPRQWKNIKTRALVVDAPGEPFRLRDIIIDEVRDDEVLVEMYYSGICHTDLVFKAGIAPGFPQFPMIFGHEGAGRILHVPSSPAPSTHTPAANNTSDLKEGDFVLLSFSHCTSCTKCLHGHPAFCESFGARNNPGLRPSDGATAAMLADSSGQSVRAHFFGQSSLAAISAVSRSCVAKVPAGWEKDGSLAAYAPLGCGFQTGAGTVMNFLKLRNKDDAADKTLVVFGLGGVGLSAVAAAAYCGVPRVVAIDIKAEKLEFAKSFGATHVLDTSSKDVDVVAEIKKVSGGRGADYCIDTTGVVPVIEAMIDALGNCGIAVQVGIPPSEPRVKIDALAMLAQNKTYVGVIEGDSVPAEFVKEMMEMHRAGKFAVEKMVRVFPVEEAEAAVLQMHEGKVIKPVLEWKKV